MLVVAVRTFAHHIAVCQELLSFFVVELFAFFLYQFAVIVELTEEVGGKLMMGFARGTAIDIERNTKLFERVFYQFVITVAHSLRSYTLFLGTQGDRNTVLVAAADEDDIFFFQSQIACVNICRDVHSCKVSYMNATVCIRQGSRNGGSLKFLLSHKLIVCIFLSAKLHQIGGTNKGYCILAVY